MTPLTSLQKQTSAQIAEATQLPAEQSNLITLYAQDFSMAQQLVVLTRNGKMINMKLRQAITEALISSHCDPQIKRRIIDNAIFDHYKSLLNEILDEIRQSGYAANFDGTDLSDLDLSGLNLTRVSAVSAKFTRSYLCSANLTDADLTGAWFQSSTLISVNFTRTILHKAFICDSDLSDACLNRTDLNQIQLQRVKTARTLFTDVMTDNAELQKILKAHAKSDSQGTRSSLLDLCLFDTGSVQKKPLTRRVITLPSRVAEILFDDSEKIA